MLHSILNFWPILLAFICFGLIWLKLRYDRHSTIPLSSQPPVIHHHGEPIPPPVPSHQRLDQIWRSCTEALRLVAEYKRLYIGLIQLKINSMGRCYVPTEQVTGSSDDVRPDLRYPVPLFTSPDLLTGVAEPWRFPTTARGNQAARTASYDELFALLQCPEGDPTSYDPTDDQRWSAMLFRHNGLEVLVIGQMVPLTTLDRFYRWLWLGHLEPHEPPTYARFALAPNRFLDDDGKAGSEIAVSWVEHPGTAAAFRPDLDRSLAQLAHTLAIGPYIFRFTARGTLPTMGLDVYALTHQLQHPTQIQRAACADGSYATVLTTVTYEAVIFMEVTE